MKGVLDREFYTKFTLQIEAFETQNKASYARINLDLKLIDENDNKPIFENDHYNFKLKEDEIIPERIISREIKAHDDDVTVGFYFIV